MTPARNVVCETKLQGPLRGKPAGGHLTRDGAPNANGDAFSALLGQAGGDATNQPAEAARAPSQVDTRVTKKTREDNGAPLRVPGSAEVAETAEEPATGRAKSFRKPDAAEKVDNSLDALLAALVVKNASVPGATVTTTEVGDQRTASGGEGTTGPANEASDPRAQASVSGSAEPSRSLDLNDDTSIGAALPKVLVEAGLESGRDMAVLDRDGIRTHPIAPTAATAVPSLALPQKPVANVGGLKSQGSKVEFVSLRTDFEPAELRRARTDAMGGKAAGQTNLPKPGAASGIERLAAFDKGRTADANVGTKAASDGDRMKKSEAPKLRLFDAGKAAPPANATITDAADTIQIAPPGRGRASAPDGSGDAGPPLTTAQQASDPSNQIRATAPNTHRAMAEGIVPASHAASVESRSQGLDETTSALTHQVASAVGTQLSTLVPSAGAPAGDVAAASAPYAATSENVRLRAGGAALKTLQIQLQPENLGTLDITMKLIGGQLAIHLAASEASTALRLKDDAEGLKKLLTKSGFDVDDAAITVSTRDGGAGRVGNASASHNGSGQNAGQAGGNGPGFGSAGQGGANGHSRSQRPNAPSGIGANGVDPAPAPSSETDGRATRNGGAVYL